MMMTPDESIRRSRQTARYGRWLHTTAAATREPRACVPSTAPERCASQQRARRGSGMAALVAPTAPGAAGAPAAPVDPALDGPPIVPDVVEDRRVDTRGNVLTRRYTRARLLGKVRARQRSATAAQQPRVRHRRRGSLPAAPRTAPRLRYWCPGALVQGGFAKCFKFYVGDATQRRSLAGKVVDKASITKHRIKQKVGDAAFCPSARAHAAERTASCWEGLAAPTPPRRLLTPTFVPAAADGDQDPPQPVAPVHRRLRVLLRGQGERVHHAGAVPQPGQRCLARR
jgi:hypothetical protein